MNVKDVECNKKEILYINFNQDATCLCVGTTEGFMIYNCENFSRPYKYLEGTSTSIAEMLFCTSLVALVGKEDQPGLSSRKVRMFNTTEQNTICDLNFVSSILSVKLNRKRMVVVMETKVHIYDIATLKILHTLDVNPNPEGLVALCPDDISYLAYPGHKGDVYIYDALGLSSVTIIEKAHQGKIVCLTINDEGTMLATASDKGTVIRVFSLPEGEKLYEFRRGTYPARIYSIAWSRDSSMLCVTSDTGTLHVYKVRSSKQKNGSRSRSNSGSGFSSYMPDLVNDFLHVERDCRQAKLPSPSSSSSSLSSFSSFSSSSQPTTLCAFNRESNGVMVVSSEGIFYHYLFEQKLSHSGGGGDKSKTNGHEKESSEKGGDGMKLCAEYILYEPESEAVSASFLE
ncbi:autophagy protein [Balamuthia mandrillaris]